MRWLFSTTIWLLACVVWIVGHTFVDNKKVQGSLNFVSAILAAVGVLLLFKDKHYAFAGTLFCLSLFIVIFNVGFSLNWQKAKVNGPLAGFVGKKGIAVSELTPKGQINIENQIIAATTEGIFIAQGKKIKVIRSGDSLVVVEKSQD